MNTKDMNCSVSDIMTCAIANMLSDGDRVFHGVASHMPMVAMMLARKTHAPNLVCLNIPGGVNPLDISKSYYSSAGEEFYKGADAIYPLINIFDLSMRGKLDVAFLGGVQFDIEGNLNSTVIGDYAKPKVKLPGGAGSAVLIPTVKKAIVWRVKHDKRTFVDRVDFATAKGNIWKIITPFCIFAVKDGKLILESVHPTSSLQEVKDNTGFEIACSHAPFTALPTVTQMNKLKQIDPLNLRAKEFEK